jgi:glycosyltransferase involved in cell wall biosynthesis
MIWIDVTDVMTWARPPVGIIRTQIELASGLLDAVGDDVRLCAFRDGAYNVVPRSQYEMKVASLGQVVAHENGPPRLSLIERLKGLYGLILSHSPLLLQRQLQKVVRVAKRVIAPLRTRLRPAVSFCEFSVGDTYLSVGRDWAIAGKLDCIKSLKARRVRLVLCCYDLIPILQPQLCRGGLDSSFDQYFRELIQTADTILCISENTKRDLVTYIDKVSDKVSVAGPRIATMLLGTDPPTFVSNPGDLADIITREYILYVSTIDPRKNHETLYKAYVTIRRRNREQPPLCVFVGMRGGGIANTLADIELDPRVRADFVILDYVSDGELKWLYEHCLFTVFPSLYEGWGLPIAESLNNGRFVLASNTSSMREAGGSFAEYLDPWSVDQWADRVMYYYSNRDALLSRQLDISANFRPFRWSNTVETVKREIDDLRPR